MLGPEPDHIATPPCRIAAKQVLYLVFQPLKWEVAMGRGITDPQPLAQEGQWEMGWGGWSGDYSAQFLLLVLV